MRLKNAILCLRKWSKYQGKTIGWWVVVSDIKGSTKAIENVCYKDVNILGASSIIAVLNSVKNVEIPLCFWR
jgi:hypothetical protein